MLFEAQDLLEVFTLEVACGRLGAPLAGDLSGLVSQGVPALQRLLGERLGRYRGTRQPLQRQRNAHALVRAAAALAVASGRRREAAGSARRGPVRVRRRREFLYLPGGTNSAAVDAVLEPGDIGRPLRQADLLTDTTRQRDIGKSG